MLEKHHRNQPKIIPKGERHKLLREKIYSPKPVGRWESDEEYGCGCGPHNSHSTSQKNGAQVKEEQDDCQLGKTSIFHYCPSPHSLSWSPGMEKKGLGCWHVQGRFWNNIALTPTPPTAPFPSPPQKSR